MPAGRLTSSELQCFHRDGFVMVRSLFDAAEIDKLLHFAHQDKGLSDQAYGRKDASGMETKLALWNDLGDDLYSMFARSRRVVDPMEQILEGEVYHYHSKLNMKEPRTGGAWEWHQDYGYWYNFGCLYPLMASCMTAVTPSNRGNGCLQVLRGSHDIGRIDHAATGDQTGADMERVEVAVQRFELVYVELEPGDAVMFHCNLLHRSDQNLSDQSRWTLISCYNARRNSPYKAGRHPQYTPLDKVSDEAIRDFAVA